MRKLLFLTLAFAFIFASSNAKDKAQKTSTKLTLEDIWASPKFVNRGISGINPLNDGKYFSSMKNISKETMILKYSFETGDVVDTIFKQSWLKLGPKNINIESYEFNADESMLLFSANSEPIYRRSFVAEFYMLNVKTKTLTQITSDRISIPTFSPDGTKIAFLRENNIYILNLSTNETTQLTFDGKKNEIINGSTDWVYEEEFEFTKAYHWSTDSRKIVYMKSDERQVPEFSMTIYTGLYPTNNTFKYPKAGEKNAIVSLHLYNLVSKKTSPIITGSEADKYIPRFGWTKNEGTFWYEIMNRHQNKVELFFVDANTFSSKNIITETSNTWVEVNNGLTFLDNKQQFIWASEKSGYNHLYLYSIEGKELNAITKGNWEVTEFYGISQKEGALYFQSTEVSPNERHLYSIKKDGSQMLKLSTKVGSTSALFSSDMQYYISTHTASGVPGTVSVHSSNGKEIRVIESNTKLRETLAVYNLSPTEFFEFKNPEGTTLNGWMIKPANMDKKKKYPVLMFVYGGPGSVNVQDKWGGGNYLWYQFLAQQGYIVACVDNRGTGGKGESFKKTTYLQLGKYETEDQITTAKYLGLMPFVDPTRIGIFGWSYGGYMSTLCITKGADVFKAAVAVAPVINWRFYDSIYTERYMKTPQENAEGYDINSPVTHAGKLKGKYLLIHGTADDNVHFQNAMVMAKELISKNKDFDFMAYPDKNHGIYGGMTRLHVFTKISNFLFQNL